MDFAMEFDEEARYKLYKQKVIDGYKTLYPHVNEHIIAQFFDFCTDESKKDYNDYLYLSMLSNEKKLSEKETKRLNRLKGKFDEVDEGLKKVKTTSLDEFKANNMEIKGAVEFSS